MNKKIFILPLLLTLFLLSGCGGSSANTGTLVMKITDAPAGLNIQKAEVTISGVQVHKTADGEAENADTESGWSTVVSESKTFDLIAIKNIKEFLGQSSLAAGKYTQVRLNVEKATATIDGKEVELTIPSRTIKLVKPFTIVANQTITLTLDFNAKESINQAGDKYIMKPTIKVIQE